MSIKLYNKLPIVTKLLSGFRFLRSKDRQRFVDGLVDVTVLENVCKTKGHLYIHVHNVAIVCSNILTNKSHVDFRHRNK